MLNITFPDAMRDELERKAQNAGFATVETHLVHLVAADGAENGEDFAAASVPDDLVIRDRADLEAKILAGLNSGPPIRATPEFWNELRERVRQRIGAPRHTPPDIADSTPPKDD